MPGRTPTSLPRSIVAVIVAALVLVACRPVPPTAKEPPPAQPAAAPASGGAPSAAEAPKPAAAAPAANAGQVKTGGVAVIATREDPPANWDPMFQTSISLAYVGISVFGDGNLVKSCPDDVYKACPALAESWTNNADFTEFTFKLRDGVLWHDGTPLTAPDIKFWLDLAYNGAKVGDKTRPAARYKAYLGDIKQVDVVDPKTVKVTLSTSTPYYMDLLTSRQVLIAHPRHLMEPKIQAGEVNVGPADVGFVALGPFKLDKADKGSVVQVRKFDKYWEKDAQGRQLPYLDGIDFPVMNDFSAVLAAFRAGRLDGGTRGGGFTLLPDQIESLQKAFGDQVWFAPINGQRQVLWFNTLKEGPLQDVRVRKAISLWMDKREGLNAIEGGNGKLTTLLDPRSPFPNPDWLTWPGYNETTRDADRNEAKRLMAEAGYAGGIELSAMGQQSWSGRYEWLQGNLAGLGVRVKLDLVDVATYNERSFRKDFLMQSAKGATITFPEGLAAIMNATSVANNTFTIHDDPKVIEFFKQFNSARNLEDRVRIYREMEKYVLLDQVLGVPMYDETQTTPYRSYVKGMPVPPEDITANLSFATTWLDK
jgi:peptide/nickel transport system substrate-binding protein